jgi:hypothetical protein
MAGRHGRMALPGIVGRAAERAGPWRPSGAERCIQWRGGRFGPRNAEHARLSAVCATKDQIVVKQDVDTIADAREIGFGWRDGGATARFWERRW